MRLNDVVTTYQCTSRINTRRTDVGVVEPFWLGEPPQAVI